MDCRAVEGGAQCNAFTLLDLEGSVAGRAGASPCQLRRLFRDRDGRAVVTAAGSEARRWETVRRAVGLLPGDFQWRWLTSQGRLAPSPFPLPRRGGEGRVRGQWRDADLLGH